MKIFTTDNKHRTLIAASFIAGLILTAAAYETGMWFRDNYKFQNPFIPLIVPLEISPIVEDEEVRIINTTTPTPKVSPRANLKAKIAIMASSRYPDFIDHIWLRESGRGKNPAGLAGYCEKKGLSNEFGFAVSVNHCFTNFETSVKRLERWYEDNTGLTYQEKLCRYNTGRPVPECAYLSFNFEEMN